MNLGFNGSYYKAQPHPSPKNGPNFNQKKYTALGQTD